MWKTAAASVAVCVMEVEFKSIQFPVLPMLPFCL